MIFGELLLYRIPIYRCNREKHRKEFEKEVEKKMKFAIQNSNISDEMEKNIREWIEFSSFVPWNYNEIIGWLDITKSWPDILIECMMRDYKRFPRAKPGRSSVRNFKFRGYKYGEVRTQHYNTSEEIFTELLKELDGIQKSEQFRKYHVDLDDFRKIGKYIDWKGLTEEIKVP